MASITVLFAAAPVSLTVASSCRELAAQLAVELSGAIIKLADWCQLDSDLRSHGVSLSCLSVNTAGHQTGSEHSASRTKRCQFEDNGIKSTEVIYRRSKQDYDARKEETQQEGTKEA